MLNELKTLADSIQAVGFSVEEWDDKFNPIKTTSPCFIISLANDGDIADIRPLDQEKSGVLKTWLGGSNGETFPSFNFQPFYKLEEGKKNKLTSTQKKYEFVNLVERVQLSTSLPETIGHVKLQNRDKSDEKTAKCLGEIAMKFFTIITKDATEDDVFIRFHNAFKCFFTDRNENLAETFNCKLATYLRKKLSDNIVPEQWELWPILYATKNDVVFFFDLKEFGSFPIASERGMKAINNRLLSQIVIGSELSQDSELDAFGQSVFREELTEKLPEVKLPGVLANTKLRSMNGESKCQTRYGRIDAVSYPVGREVRKATKAALSWISSPEREGKTWAIAGANELVFAYPKNMPPSPPLLARLLGNGRSSIEMDKNKEARFEQYAEDALKGMKTLASTRVPNAEIEVFAIKKVDKARRKVVFYRNYSLERLELAVNDWNEGAKNIPPITLRRWPLPPKGEKLPKGTPPIPMEFHAPLPLSAIEIAYSNWSQDGNESQEPKFRFSPLYKIDKKDKKGKYPLSDGIELFLGDPITTGMAQRILALLLQNSSGLCASAGNLAHKHDVISNIRAVRHLETALPLFGILLHKLNHNKETYMENAPYLIGRFLNLADGLHALWCKNVRDNQIPPQLLGSSLFASFQMNPVQAFGNASLRIKPYLDWAKTNKSQDAALSRWFLGEFGRVCTAIKATGIPQRLSDTDKAEMLLGYLASSGKQDESEPSQHEPSK